MIKLLSIHFNNPSFLEFQIKSFKKHLKNEFEFICIDNCKDSSYAQQFQNICKQYKITYIPTNNKNHELAGLSHQVAVKYIFDNLIKTNDIYCIFDHDIFMLNDLNLEEMMKDISIYYFNQTRHSKINNTQYNYIFPGFMIFNIKLCPNIHEISFEGIAFEEGLRGDSGSNSYHYLQKYKEQLKLKTISKLNFITFPTENKNVNMEIYDDIFLHYRIGSNWINFNSMQIKMKNDKLTELLKV